MKMKWKTNLNLLFLLLLAVFILSLIMIWREISDRQKEKDKFDTLSKLVTPIEVPIEESIMPIRENTISAKEIQVPITENTESVQFHRNLAPLFKDNSDCIGWICIPDTTIDYPVMYTPDDPQKYLKKDFNGESSVSGVPFLDYRCKLNSDNLILYGHNMRNGTMFSAVKKYVKKEYFNSHLTIELETATEYKTYTIFAAVPVKKTDEWYNFITAENKKVFDKAISEIQAKAKNDSGIIPKYGKQLLTLSTCYGSSKDDRFLIIAAEN